MQHVFDNIILSQDSVVNATSSCDMILIFFSRVLRNRKYIYRIDFLVRPVSLDQLTSITTYVAITSAERRERVIQFVSRGFR
jgi:hypothetical protein